MTLTGQFLGAWLDNRLHSGPEDETRDRIARDFARQGWFVREGRLVSGDPVYPDATSGRSCRASARLDALHPRVVEVSHALFEDEHRAAAILQAFIAANNRVKEMAGRAELDGVDLMAQVFRPETPVLVRWLDGGDRTEHPDRLPQDLYGRHGSDPEPERPRALRPHGPG